ncbi:hypothetical protein SRHO_G00286950 [Serrasalmus rhombeus]
MWRKQLGSSASLRQSSSAVFILSEQLLGASPLKTCPVLRVPPLRGCDSSKPSTFLHSPLSFIPVLPGGFRVPPCCSSPALLPFSLRLLPASPAPEGCGNALRCLWLKLRVIPCEG